MTNRREQDESRYRLSGLIREAAAPIPVAGVDWGALYQRIMAQVAAAAATGSDRRENPA